MNHNTLKKLGPLPAYGLLIIFVGRFLIESYARAITNSNSGMGDQGAFLQLGLDFVERGLPTDGTRNPLYALFLAAIARREWAYFTEAKLLSMAFGALTIVAVFVLGRRYFNTFTGLTAAYLMSINVEFIVHSATALTESLLVLFFTLAWFAMLDALRHKRLWPAWALAGALVALAYLAKGSGQLMMFAFIITGFLIYRFQLFKGRSLWAFLAAYVLLVSPFWLYNTVTYGSPTFNYAITHQMWMERWNDWHPDNTANLPTLTSYLQEHTPTEILERQWNGMRAVRNMLVKALYPTRTLMVDNFLLSPWSGITLAVLALLPFIFWRSSWRFFKQHQPLLLLTAFTIAIFFVLFSWYAQIIIAARFLLPLSPLIFVTGAYIISLMGHSLMQRGRWGQALVALTLITVLLLQGRWWVRTLAEPLDTFLASDLYNHDREFGADAAAPLAWLAAGAAAQPPTVAWGPSGHSLPIWAYSDRLDYKRYPPNVDTIPELTEDFINRQVDFVILDHDMVARHRDLLRQEFPSNGYQVELPQIPDGWALAYAHRTIPCDWCVFRLPAGDPPQQPVEYRLGDAIRLTGYDLSSRQVQPGQTVHLTLHWQADEPPPGDYTTFTQLLGPDWQLHGQKDNQPVNNLWPTSRWQPGDYVADRYDIPLSPTAPPGEYQLLVGMYDAASGERLPIIHNGQPLPDNVIFLDTLTVAP